MGKCRALVAATRSVLAASSILHPPHPAASVAANEFFFLLHIFLLLSAFFIDGRLVQLVAKPVAKPRAGCSASPAAHAEACAVARCVSVDALPVRFVQQNSAAAFGSVVDRQVTKKTHTVSFPYSSLKI